MREKVSGMDINAHISKLRNVQRVSEDVVRLVESDLKYGLSIAETEEYTSKRFDYSQMKVYSACLRKEYPGEVRQCIMREGLSGEQMAVALEYYEKVSKEYKAELERYERENGPVSLSSDTVTDGNKWQWVNTPWPWQNEKAERGN